MATILESVGDYLVTNSLGTLGTNLFLGTMPETPDECVAVYENSGSAPMFTMGTGGIVIDYPMIQIVARAGREDYPTARDKAESIRTLLASVLDSTISSVNPMIQMISIFSEPSIYYIYIFYCARICCL